MIDEAPTLQKAPIFTFAPTDTRGPIGSLNLAVRREAWDQVGPFDESLSTSEDHDWMLRAGWDAVHPRVGLTGAFYSRFTPGIGERDFALRPGVPAQLQRALDLVAVCRL